MDFESKILSLSKKYNCELEFFSQNERSLLITAERNSIHSNNSSNTGGFAVRTIKGRQLGFYSYEKESELEGAVKKALALGKLQEKADYYFPKKSGSCSKYLDRRALDFEVWGAKELSEMLAVQKDAKVMPVQNLLGVSTSSDILINSQGGHVKQSASAFFSVSQCSYKEAEGDFSESSSRFNFDPKTVAKKALEFAIASASAKSAPKGKMDVVFSHHALQELFALFLPFNFSGESSRKKLSKIGRGNAIAQKNISILDNPTLFEGLKPCEFDDEGTYAKPKHLVKDGRVCDFLFDMNTAAKMSGEIAGNGFRASFQSAPTINHCDLEILGGDVSDIVSETKKGILVHSFLTSGANAVTGDFSFPLLIAFKIESGEKKSPIKDAMIKGNFFSLMKNAKFERIPELHNGLKTAIMSCELEIIS